jgi:Organic solvent tolerance protein.
VKTLTQRLLDTDLLVTRPFGDWSTYARALRWQVLQTVDPTTRIDPPPYDRAPQIGARYAAPARGGFDVALETEFNRFANPDDRYVGDRQTGLRAHALGSVARPFLSPGWSLIPKLSFNAASYSVDLPLADGGHSASRIIPTLSVDSAWTLERDATSSAAPFARRSSRGCSTSTRRTGARTTCPTSTPSRRISTSIRSSPRTRFPASTASPIRTSSPPA